MSDTKTYKVLRPIGFKGDRLEKDAIVEMTDEEAANIGPDVELVPAPTDDSEEKSSDDSEESKEDGASDEGSDEGSSDKDETEKDTSADESKAE